MGSPVAVGVIYYLGTPAQAADEVSTIVRLVKHEQPTARILPAGREHGRAFAPNHFRENSSQIRGLIVLAPAIAVHNHQLFRIRNLGLLPYLLFAQRTPAIRPVDQRLEESSRVAQFITERRTDPLAYKQVSFGYLWDIKHRVRNGKTESAPNLHAPTLVVQGGKDVIVNRKECEALTHTNGTRERQYKLFPEARHTTLGDPATADILKIC
jgi:alpha-beta hydrolase superfamily lysophospholipase